MERAKYQLGEIVAIPLPDGRFGYGRMYRDLNIGIYQSVSESLLDAAQVRAFSITRIVFFDPDLGTSPPWSVIGSHPFTDQEDAWGPPRRHSYWVYHKGTLREPKSLDELNSIDDLYFHEPHEVIALIYREILHTFPPPGLEPTGTSVFDSKPIEKDPLETLFDHDTAASVRMTFAELLDGGMSVSEATQQILQIFAEELNDSEDQPHVIFALAALQIKHQAVQSESQRAALNLLQSRRTGRGLPNTTIDERQVALAELEARLKRIDLES